MVFAANTAETPAGKPVTAPMPVAPVVVIVMPGDKTVLIHKVGVLDGEPAILAGVTVIVPVALTVPHPPVNGML